MAIAISAASSAMLPVCRQGRRSWQPWLISLAVDAASAALIDGGAALHRRACKTASEDPTLHHGSLALLYSMQALRYTPDNLASLVWQCPPLSATFRLLHCRQGVQL